MFSICTRDVIHVRCNDKEKMRDRHKILILKTRDYACCFLPRSCEEKLLRQCIVQIHKNFKYNWNLSLMRCVFIGVNFRWKIDLWYTVYITYRTITFVIWLNKYNVESMVFSSYENTLSKTYMFRSRYK